MRFNFIFATVLTLTVASGGTAVDLGKRPSLTEPQSRVFITALATWTAGTTTLFGLLGIRTGQNSKGKDR